MICDSYEGAAHRLIPAQEDYDHKCEDAIASFEPPVLEFPTAEVMLPVWYVRARTDRPRMRTMFQHPLVSTLESTRMPSTTAKGCFLLSTRSLLLATRTTFPKTRYPARS
jgi:hypothetical protein